jgi:hypothetical protein
MTHDVTSTLGIKIIVTRGNISLQRIAKADIINRSIAKKREILHHQHKDHQIIHKNRRPSLSPSQSHPAIPGTGLWKDS